MNKLDQYSYLIMFIIPLLILCGYIFSAPYLFFVLVFICYFLIEVIDFILPKDKHYSYDVIKSQDNESEPPFNFYQIIIVSYLVFQLIVLFIALYFVAYKEPSFAWFIMAIPLGISAASGLNVAHELMHKGSIYKKILARIYGLFQFFSLNDYHHVYYHHRMDLTATPKDIGSAQKGQSIYQFIISHPAAVIKDAWEMEARRLQGKNKMMKSIRNRVILVPILTLILFAFVVYLFSWLSLLFLIVQALISTIAFYLVTYNQHYGLIRHKIDDNTYEEQSYQHSWSCDRYLNSRLLMNLTRHAHHHLYPLCPYQNLKIIENSPILPLGYLGSMFVCLIPPLWYKLMNDRVDEVNKKFEK